MKNKLFSILVLLFASFDVLAECMPTYCTGVKIQEMQVHNDGVVWIQTTGTEANLTNCTSEASVFIKLDATSSGGKAIYSALLSAQARDKAIKIRTIDNVSPCQAHYVVVE